MPSLAARGQADAGILQSFSAFLNFPPFSDQIVKEGVEISETVGTTTPIRALRLAMKDGKT